MIECILIANRGEAAVRVARTCRRLGIETVGLTVDSEGNVPHAEACDRILVLGHEAPLYWDPAALVKAALDAGAHAVHPGYGGLSASPDFAQQVESQGLLFIGPGAERFEAARDRLALRSVAEEAGVRVLPGSDRPVLDLADARRDAETLGYPVAIVPVQGIGEPIPALADDDEGLEGAVASLGELADVGGALVLSRVERARHVEVQLAYDGAHAHVLGDREVSLRRDGRRLLGETPACALDQLHQADAVRGALWDASVEITTRVGARGLTSCRFVLDGDGVFYFTSFNAGLETEHAVHELCTGLDLVELQLELAAGQSLDEKVLRTEPHGSALQARIDAAADPATGQPFDSRVEHARWPPAPQGKVRIEAGVSRGTQVDPSHEPLVATVSTYAPGRHDALLMLDRVLAEVHLSPLVTNLRLLRKALNDESFRAGQYDDGFLDRS
jgi:acetyl/propionyl-CoA carboxylase alpha subunit